MKNSTYQKGLSNFLKLKGYSKQTILCYCNCLGCFLNYFESKKEPKNINSQEIRGYLLDLNSVSLYKQTLGSLKLFYKNIINQPLKLNNIPYPKKIEYLPNILSPSQIIFKINNISNLKHKSIISLLYGCGLRRQEIINLKIKNILKDQNLIKIEQSKGNKDRYVPISKSLLQLLREYYKLYNPHIYLFNGQGKKSQYSPTSIVKIVKNNLGEQFSPHTLRHCYATHLYEKEVELDKIQKLLGHSNIKSTQIYTKLANNLQNIPSLL